MKTKKQLSKLSMIAMLLVLWSGLGFAQTTANLWHDGGDTTIIYNFETENFVDLHVSKMGDVTVNHTPGFGQGQITVTSTGVRFAVVTLNLRYKKNESEITEKMRICGDTLRSKSIHFTFCKTFPVTDEIEGSGCIVIGEHATFSIREILSNGRNYPSDVYVWDVPNDWVLKTISEQGHMVTYTVGSIPTTPISVKVGGCNNHNSATRFKTIEGRATAPALIYAPPPCFSANTREIRVEFANPYPLDFEWVLSNHDWNFLEKTKDVANNTIFARIDVGVSAGVVALKVFGACDTAYVGVDITRSIGGGATEIGDIFCAIEDSITPFSIYPAPNQRITWEFPEGWTRDTLNPNSSKVKVLPRAGEAESGWVKAWATHEPCSGGRDSIWVDMKPHAPNEIEIVGVIGHCLEYNTTYTFTSTTVRHGNAYRWVFPDGWDYDADEAYVEVENRLISTNIFISATPTINANAGEVRLYVYGAGSCTDSSYTSYEVKFMPKNIENVLLLGCLNKGMNTANVVYMIQNAENGVDYVWDIPNNWHRDNSQLNPYAATLHLSLIEQTLDEADNQYQLTVYGTNACGRSTDDFVLDIIHDGFVYIPDDDFDFFFPLIFNFDQMIDFGYGWPDDYNAWFVLFPHPGNWGKIQFDWYVNCTSQYNFIFDPTLIRPYMAGEGFAEVIFYSSTGEGCKSKLGIDLKFNSIYNSFQQFEPLSQPQMRMASATKKSEEKLEIFPNPAEQDITVRLSEEMSATNFFIYDSQGRFVRRITSNNKEFSINVSDLSNGTYILMAIDGNEVVSSRIVISK
jgi:hypothetical protein